MKYIPFPLVRLVGVAGLVLLLSLGLRTAYSTATAQTQSKPNTGGTDNARAQLRIAVASNNDAELQKLETAFPHTEEAALARLLRGYLRLQAKDYATAIALSSDPAIATYSALGDYALQQRAQSLHDSGQAELAEKTYRQLANKFPTSLLARPATLQAAGSAFLRGEYQTTLNDLAALAEAKDATALKLKADALEKLGRRADTINTLRQLYFEAPHSAEAGQVAARLTALGASTAAADANQLRHRADRLFSNSLYVLAGQAYEQLARMNAAAANDDAWLRAGISYYKGNSFASAITALGNVRARTPKLVSESQYYLGASNFALHNEAQTLAAITEIKRIVPDSPYIAALLFSLGRSYEKRSLLPQAAAYYEQVARQFPTSPNADEAHFWLAWRAHEAKDYATAARLLAEHLALYGNTTENRGKAAFWAAVDAERAGDRNRAVALYRALQKRYGAGWYGINAERRASMLVQTGAQALDPTKDAALAKAIAGLQDITRTVETLKDSDRERLTKANQLATIALHQSAFNELEAARANAGTSPLINLRIAQLYRQRNEPTAAINALKRAYPDYAQTLPEEMSREAWEVFYPLNFWSAIKEQAKTHHLDPYYIAGLIRQETIFNPQARSRANAIGLMQLLPSTGQLVARKYGVGGGRVALADLYNPMINLQLGTGYLAQLVGEFGRLEYVAAAYNGGPSRVARWLRERPNPEIEEWVESIPLSETRLYVQGVYRNMRQYQRLYDEQGRFKSNVPSLP
ncbi:MAG: transglycosylase SLT domain-containing protein [Acidobacteria bacterium]|nr:transglycosylase SLT domain-containing protein [Acidobacteriota bacterium]MBI3421963.1 transglycosylase SLT domain-containing protein [Acidobacteriota bacterium]